ncbi:hypothetical protein [Salininema proteolyticum]|uniref:Uncharacterized protein n=1 Tax=Salininema proteolyticum TaxID=1607685 RepID=A0ABV8U047_9ACTN
MTEHKYDGTATVTHPEHGRIAFSWRDDWEHSETVYTLHGRHIHGSMTVAYDPNIIYQGEIPDVDYMYQCGRLVFRPGTREATTPDWSNGHSRWSFTADPLDIHGSLLAPSYWWDIAEVQGRRPFNEWRYTEVRKATRAKLRAVIELIAHHWLRPGGNSRALMTEPVRYEIRAAIARRQRDLSQAQTLMARAQRDEAAMVTYMDALTDVLDKVPTVQLKVVRKLCGNRISNNQTQNPTSATDYRNGSSIPLSFQL